MSLSYSTQNSYCYLIRLFKGYLKTLIPVFNLLIDCCVFKIISEKTNVILVDTFDYSFHIIGITFLVARGLTGLRFIEM